MKSWKIFALFLIVALFYSYGGAGHTLYSTESPDGEYKVNISQERGLLLLTRYVYLNVKKGNEPVLEKQLILMADNFEGDYRDFYPNYSWLTPNILTIGNYKENPAGRLKILNNGKEVIKYLLIENYEDKFLIFDLEPGSIVDLKFNASTYLSVQAGVGKKSGSYGDAVILKDFEIPQNTNFEVEVNGQKVRIAVPGYEIKQIPCCGVKRT